MPSARDFMTIFVETGGQLDPELDEVDVRVDLISKCKSGYPLIKG